MTPSEQMSFLSQIALLKAASKELHKAIDNIIVELRESEDVEHAHKTRKQISLSKELEGDTPANTQTSK